MILSRLRTRPIPLQLSAALLLLSVAACGGSGPEDGRDSGRPDTGANAVPARDRPTTPPWREGQLSEAGEAHAILQAVRTGQHEGYDRLVLEFEGGVPSYTVRFAERQLHQCGSGFPIEVDAPHTFQIELQSVAAHDEEGRPTVEDRDRKPGLGVLRSARLTCDFEGVVEWVLGLDHRTEFRVFRLDEPTRLVVDLRHP
jgi:hypothetical protein